jgi:hypothetical protein
VFLTLKVLLLLLLLRCCCCCCAAAAAAAAVAAAAAAAAALPGMCHSDLHTINGDWGPAKYPVVPG